MNLRDLRYLVALADHRHFGRAAEASYVSQPTLSTQVKKLETELGVALIERNPGQVLLTPVGEQVVDRARSALVEVDTIHDLARRAQEPESGTVRMGLFPTLAPYLLPHVVPELHRRFPELELLLVEEKTEVVLDRLRSGRLDLGVLALPVPEERLHCEPLFTEDFLLAVPSDHRLAAHDGPVAAGVLADEDLLLLEEGHCLRDQALEVCEMHGAAEHDGFRATSLETLRQMVAAGVGITLLPALAVQPPVPPSPDIRLLRFAEPVPRREIALLWRESSPFTDLYPLLADVLRRLPEDLTGVTPATGRPGDGALGGDRPPRR